MAILRKLVEAFEGRKFQKGKVNFSSSAFADPHIVTAIDEIAKARGVTPQQVQAFIQSKIDEFADVAKVAPILYETINKNIVENEVFHLFAKTPVEVPSPKFDGQTFNDIVRSIQADHDEFWPLRGFIDRKRLYNPVFTTVNVPVDFDAKSNEVMTAAATPRGEFIFNVPFMQKLLDYAHIKGIKPKSRKYKSNGGTIPDEYAYIEFLIMHEFMHYTNDDFYYNKIIPNADMTIINWVGDFRSNYLLVKSGYEQIPMGLFNDDINYDRQSTYLQMYEAIKKEFEKLKKQKPQQGGQGQQQKGQQGQGQQGQGQPGQGQPGEGQPGEGEPGEGQPGKGKGKPGQEQGDGGGSSEEEESDLAKKVKRKLNGMGDDHEPGTKEAQEKGIDPSKQRKPEDIDDRGKSIQKQMEEAKDTTPGEAAKKQADRAKQQQGKSQKGSPGSGEGGGAEVDYKKIAPTFNWAAIVRRFVASKAVGKQESYAKPNRRAVSSMEIVRQTGAGAIKPAEAESDFVDLKLAFVLDCSGSMMGDIGKVFANANALLKQPKFARSEVYVITFSGSHHVFKGIFAKNSAREVKTVNNMKQGKAAYNLKMSDIFANAESGGTVVSAGLQTDINTLLSQGYNVLMCTDTDILYGENLTRTLDLIKKHPQKMFMIFDDRNTYVQWRKTTGVATPNITHFS